MAIAARRTSEPPIGSRPSGTLLSLDGVLAPVQPPAPERTLAAEALRVLRRFADPALVPPAWSEAAFIREVGLVRAHLAPIHTRGGLAASFSREAFHARRVAGGDDVPGAVRVAYALRWLELGSRRAVPAWPPATIASDAVS